MIKYYYVVTLENGKGTINYRVTMTKGFFSLASIIDEGVIIFNWKEITREQCIDLIGEENTKEYEALA